MPADQTDLRYCVLISCFSKNDIRKRKDMWIKYTAHGHSEDGFLLVYKKDDLVNAAKNQVKTIFKKYDDVRYCSKKKNDKTSFYIELFKIILNDEAKKMFYPQVYQLLRSNIQIYSLEVTALMKQRGFYDDAVDDLIYSKEKCWSSENEWRLIEDNKNFNVQSPSSSNSYGDILVCQPIAIYIRRKVAQTIKNN